MVLIIARWQGPPRLPLAPLAVLGPGPMLAAAQNEQGEKWRKMALFRGPKPPFSLLGAGASKYKPLIWRVLCWPTSLARQSKKNVGRHFRARTFFDATRRGRLRSEGDTVSIRRQGESLVLQPIKSATWPLGFFDRVRIDDPAFARPAQGRVPPAPKRE